jgi:hypothetical protein
MDREKRILVVNRLHQILSPFMLRRMVSARLWFFMVSIILVLDLCPGEQTDLCPGEPWGCTYTSHAAAVCCL